MEEADLCVVGGSCTGVFAAVHASRLGLRVVLLEKQNILGGTATAGLVNIWHSLHDTDWKNQIIAGLTHETVERLSARYAVECRQSESSAYIFNPFELAFVLDEYIRENKIRLMLHTSYSAVVREGRRLDAVIIENTEGRFAVKAKFFIDASGDGRIAGDLGIASYRNKKPQPPTACFYIKGNTKGLDMGRLVSKHARYHVIDDQRLLSWSPEMKTVNDNTVVLIEY